MTAEIVNLRRVRKAKARVEKQLKGSENRARFGRTKQERLAQEAEAQREAKAHAGNERAPRPEPPATE